MVSSTYHTIPNTTEDASTTSAPETLKVRRPTWKLFAPNKLAQHVADNFIIEDGAIRDEDGDIIQPYQPPCWRQEISKCNMNEPFLGPRNHRVSTDVDYARLYRQVLKYREEAKRLENAPDDVHINTLRKTLAQRLSVLKLLSVPSLPKAEKWRC